MPETLNDRLIIAVTSQTLFDLTESNHLFEEEGVESYAKYQRENEGILLKNGPGYRLITKLLHLNDHHPCVEVVLMSRNSSDTGLRIFNSIEAHQLNITRAVFTSGRNPYRYACALGAHLFLSTNPDDVRHALESGLAAATMSIEVHADTQEQNELRIAFDGDAVIFSDEAEQVFQSSGLKAFHESEKQSAKSPLESGPFFPFLAALKAVQKKFPADACPIRLALITARQAPAHERVIRTLRDWDIRLDECIFLGGLEKTEFLKAFNADIYFDDQRHHCQKASNHVPTAHVPAGIINKGVFE